MNFSDRMKNTKTAHDDSREALNKTVFTEDQYKELDRKLEALRKKISADDLIEATMKAHAGIGMPELLSSIATAEILGQIFPEALEIFGDLTTEGGKDDR